MATSCPGPAPSSPASGTSRSSAASAIKPSSTKSRVSWNPVVLGIAVLVLSLCSRLPHAISALVFLTFLAYLPVVVTIERINTLHQPAVQQPLNGNFTGWNIAGIVVGGLLLALSLLGLIIST